MTRPRDPYAAFLRKLRQTPRTWVVESDGTVRFGHGLFRSCPVVKAAGSYGIEWRRYVVRAGLTLDSGEAVVRAVDYHPRHDHRLRARLLRACGITEPTR